MVQYLSENRRLWNDMYLADIEADTFKTPAEKVTEKVRSPVSTAGALLAQAMCAKPAAHCNPNAVQCQQPLGDSGGVLIFGCQSLRVSAVLY